MIERQATYPLVKRTFDVIGATTLLVLLSPVMLVIAVLVCVRLGRPVLWRQLRPGLGGAAFTLYKFRTMADLRDYAGNLLPDEERLSSFGRFLRSSSLDELPELFNVIRGDMSLVGPRPLLMKYLERYTPEQMRRHDLPPGITGWAQVSGRNALTWEEKFKLDVWYVEQWCLALDIKILLRTVWVVLSRTGISSDGHATMPEFLGSEREASDPAREHIAKTHAAVSQH